MPPFSVEPFIGGREDPGALRSQAPGFGSPESLAKAGVAFVALKENIRVEGKSNIQTKVLTTLFALFAEVERDLILRAHPRGPLPGPGPRAGSSAARKGSLASRLDGKEDRNPALPPSWVKPSPTATPPARC